jgi:hypothetical protein
MPGLVVALFLVTSLFLVLRSVRTRPIRKDKPLDVDEELPLPELCQSSTVFSLTALFGAYFGIALALGLPALVGLAFGTVLGLFLVAHWIKKSGQERFEGFLEVLLKGDERNAVVYAFVISFVQCAYATSELLILRELAKIALGLKSEQATLLAIGVAIMGYFFVLLGGYLGLFRTDVVQLGLVSLMAVVSGGFLLFHWPTGWTARLLARPGFWQLPLMGSSRWLYLYHFGIAAVMGLGFILASPDTWKRVFQVLRKWTKPRSRALTFVAVGTLPYIVLLPFAIAISTMPERPVKKGFMVSSSFSGNWVFMAASLGLIASFLSSFDSALLASVHVQLMLQRKKLKVDFEERRFHWLMVAALLTIWILFAAGVRFSNPWLLGNALIGAYATIAGVQIGTRGDISRLPGNSLHWIFGLSIAGWLLYFSSKLSMLKTPTIYSVNTVPLGVLFFFVAVFLCKLFISGGRYYARHRHR